MTSKGEGDVMEMTSWSCAVCGDAARGRYFGAVVCLPCKSFFIRCMQRTQPGFRHRCNGTCDVTNSGHIRCSRCRFQKCLSAGMRRKERPEVVVPTEEERLCAVCGDIANGWHFGVLSCEGCKKFFRRGLTEQPSYSCRSSGKCPINPRVRTSCRYCRFQRCLLVGMARAKKGRNMKRKRPHYGSPNTDSLRHQDLSNGQPEVHTHQHTGHSEVHTHQHTGHSEVHTHQHKLHTVPEQQAVSTTQGHNIHLHGADHFKASFNELLEELKVPSDFSYVKKSSSSLSDSVFTDQACDVEGNDRPTSLSDFGFTGHTYAAGTDIIPNIRLSFQDELTSSDSQVSSRQREGVIKAVTDCTEGDPVCNDQGESVVTAVTDASDDGTALGQKEVSEAEHANNLVEELCKVMNDLSQEIHIPLSSSPENCNTDPSPAVRTGTGAVTASSSKVLTSSDDPNTHGEPASPVSVA